LRDSGGGVRSGGLLSIAAFQLAGANSFCTWRPWPVVSQAGRSRLAIPIPFRLNHWLKSIS
jgi:hypothetical protein